MNEKRESKRDFLVKAAYVVPAILTLKAIPTFAGSGSSRAETRNSGVGNVEDNQPLGNPQVNDREKKYQKLGRKSRV